MTTNDAKLIRASDRLVAGAAAFRYAALASSAGHPVGLPPNFTYRVLLEPLAALGGLLSDETPRPRARRRPKRRKAPRRVEKPLAPPPTALPEPPANLDAFEERVSSWDPEEYAYGELSDPVVEAGNCRALLLEVIRRAAYDWVLYRQSSKLQNKQLAENAYHWLFVENEESSSWDLRERGQKIITAFIAICDILDLDPDKVRARVRQLTERDIMGAGRPAERRKAKRGEDDMLAGDEHSVFDVDMSSIPTFDPMFATGG